MFESVHTRRASRFVWLCFPRPLATQKAVNSEQSDKPTIRSGAQRAFAPNVDHSPLKNGCTRLVFLFATRCYAGVGRDFRVVAGNPIETRGCRLTLADEDAGHSSARVFSANMR